MPILSFEGFDDTDGSTNDLNVKTTLGGISTGGNPTLFICRTPGRFGVGYYLTFSAGNSPTGFPLTITGNTNPSTNIQYQYNDMILGFSELFAISSINPNTTWITISNTTTGVSNIVYFSGDNNGNMIVYNGYNVPIGSFTNVPFRDGAWHYYEFRIKLHPTAGIVQLRVDGTNIINLTGINTATTAENFNRFTLLGRGYTSSESLSTITGTNFAIDDIYLVDNSDATGFLGEVRNTYVAPTADTATKNFTPSSGANNFSRLTETFQDGDTSYVQSTTINDTDIYQLGSISIASSSVLAVQPIVVTKTSVAPCIYDFSIGFGGTTYYQSGGLGYIPGQAAYKVQNGNMYFKNPFTNVAWANSDIGNSFIGIKRLL